MKLSEVSRDNHLRGGRLFLPIIGLEVHVELKTKTKMFCGCSASHFQVKANTHVCPVCLGLPGALPVPNEKAIDWCLMLGMALNCQINDQSKFDRKNYFYPDLPKGYQISQYDLPFAVKGKLNIKYQISKIKNTNEKSKIIRINRVHLEEDTGKLIHDRGNYSLIDFNRSGVPLVEIVTEPEINSAEEAVDYLKKLQQIIRYLDISDADMEKGSLRLEVNISLLRISSKAKLPDYKVEVKNLNSFKFVQKAIDFEIERQAKILQSGKKPIQETRGFNEKRGITFSQRTKETASDYRYFPEPDIPPFTELKAKSLQLKAKLPELPDEKIKRYVEKLGLSLYQAETLIKNRPTAEFFDQVVKLNSKNSTQEIVNLLINKRVNICKVTPQFLAKQVKQKQRQPAMDKKEVETVIERVISDNKKAILDFQKGKKQVLGFLVGKVMSLSKGQAEPKIINKLLIEKISKTP